MSQYPNQRRHHFNNRGVLPTAHVEREFGISFEPCPFCHMPYPIVNANHHAQVECTKCGAEGPISSEKGYEGVRQAVELWNLRSKPEDRPYGVTGSSNYPTQDAKD